jgi:uncharacterized repeat protein (TIGR02543 family)
VLRKIYIPYTVETITEGGISIEGENVFLPAQTEMQDFYFAIHSSSGHDIIFVTEELYTALDGGNSDFWQDRLKTPNLIYYFNYTDAPNSGYYWFDNITGENLYIVPNDPIRDGYKFTGWFLDADCEVEWDKKMPTSSDEKLTLYAGWEEK